MLQHRKGPALLWERRKPESRGGVARAPTPSIVEEIVVEPLSSSTSSFFFACVVGVCICVGAVDDLRGESLERTPPAGVSEVGQSHSPRQGHQP